MNSIAPPTFDRELSDVEELLADLLPKDEDLQELDEATEVEVEGLDPSEGEGSEHKIHPIEEPKLTRESLWGRSDAHPLILNLLMLEYFEHDWLAWDPELVEDTVSSLWATPHPVNLGKILAVQAAFTKYAAWDEWHYFVYTCQAFNDELVDPEAFRPPTVAEAGICVTILTTLDDKPFWSDEVKTFLQQVLTFEQFLYPPKPLDFVPPPKNTPTYDQEKIEKIRKNPLLADETLEGFFGVRLHDYDEAQMMMRQRLRQQLPLVRRRS